MIIFSTPAHLPFRNGNKSSRLKLIFIFIGFLPTNVV